MFQIGFGELMVVLFVALWVMGPEKLPVAAKIGYRWIKKIQHSLSGIKQEWNEECDKFFKEKGK